MTRRSLSPRPFPAWTPLAVLCLLVPLLAALCAAPAQAQDTGQQGSFDDTTEVVVIEIPVQVHRDGEPVRGLTREDFEVRDGRTEREIVDFEVVDLSIETPAGERPQQVPVAARRHFLFLFDLAFSDLDAVVQAREAALDVVREAMHPSDLAAVSTFSLARGPQIILGFTSDRRQIEAAIETLGAPQVFDSSGDPLGLVAADLQAFEERTVTRAAGDGSVGEDSPEARRQQRREGFRQDVIAHLRSMAFQSQRTERDQSAAEVQAMAQSLGDLAKLLGSVEGRKHVVYLSEGYDSELLVGEERQTTDIGTQLDIESGNIAQVDSRQLYGNVQLQNDIEQMLEELRRANAVVHAVDIGGLRAGGDIRGRVDGKTALVNMSRSTGGDFYENFNDLSEAMDRMMERTSVTYLLTIQPDDLELDGDYRRLRVEVRDQPRGTEVDHRAGYYAPLPYAEQNPFSRRLNVAEAILSGAEGGPIDTEILVAAFQIEGGPAYVPVLVEIDGDTLLEGATGPTLPAEIYVYAMDDQGAFQDWFTQNLSLDLGQVREALSASGLKFFGHLDLPPGPHTVRILVRDAQSGRYTVQVAEVDVPAATTTTPVLLPPMFPEEPGSWLMVRESEARQNRDVAYPFMAGDQPFIPSARARVDAGERAQLLLMGYNLEGELGIDAKVLRPDGSPAPAGRLLFVGRQGMPGPLSQMLAQLDPETLDPGHYELRVTVTDNSSGASSTGSTPFQVVASGAPSPAPAAAAGSDAGSR